MRPPLAFDADANRSVEALSDGILILRFLFGFADDQLTHGALGTGCERCGAVAIAEYLDGLGPMLDVDDNGEIDPYTDGLLITRYLFDFRGDMLIEEALGDRCRRCKARDIETYLHQMTTP